GVELRVRREDAGRLQHEHRPMDRAEPVRREARAVEGADAHPSHHRALVTHRAAPVDADREAPLGELGEPSVPEREAPTRHPRRREQRPEAEHVRARRRLALRARVRRREERENQQRTGREASHDPSVPPTPEGSATMLTSYASYTYILLQVATR